MNKILYIIALMLFSSFSIQAQNTKLFRFITKNEINGVKHVLFHNLRTNALETKQISSEEYNKSYGYLESFILQPVGNNGEVYIISAKSPEYFLKAGTGDFTPVSFSKRTDGDNDNDYKWTVIVGSNDGETIAFKSSNGTGFGLAYPQESNANVTFSAFRNANGLSYRPLLNNALSDPPVHFHSSHLFKMENTKNVF